MIKMKKILVIILVLFSINIFSNICIASFSVNPVEITINMNDEIINANTTKKITIKNNNDYTQDYTWYVTHPEPIEWIRPGKKIIPNLEWITIKPKKITIDANSTGFFYIHLYIPDEKTIYDETWETWIVIRPMENKKSFFKEEYAIRTYITTPKQKKINNDIIKTIDTKEQNKFNLTFFSFSIVLILSAILFILIVLHNKKTKK